MVVVERVEKVPRDDDAMLFWTCIAIESIFIAKG